MAEKTIQEKSLSNPTVKLSGEDGNIFNLLGIANNALRKAGQSDKIAELGEKVTSAHSYTEALGYIGEYVDVM